jgi:hypothetical protein
MVYNNTMGTGVIALTIEQHKRLDTINKANVGFCAAVEGVRLCGGVRSPIADAFAYPSEVCCITVMNGL